MMLNNSEQAPERSGPLCQEASIMEQKTQIGIRYCGGCNPRFDRVALVRRLAAWFPQADFQPVKAGVPYAAAVVVCGCTAQCAGTADLNVPPQRLIRVCDDADQLDRARQLLEELLPARSVEEG